MQGSQAVHELLQNRERPQSDHQSVQHQSGARVERSRGDEELAPQETRATNYTRTQKADSVLGASGAVYLRSEEPVGLGHSRL